MSEEVFEQTSECSHDCSSCGSSCGSRQPSKEELLAPMNQYSRVKKVIGIVSGKGGVGKSFVTSYLTTLMNRKGCTDSLVLITRRNRTFYSNCIWHEDRKSSR